MRIIKAKIDLCSGCEMCMLNCSLSKTGIVNSLYARIRLIRTEHGAATPVFCRHCKNAPCLAVCKVPGAMKIDERTGAVVINDGKCTGCLDCAKACPFDAIFVGPNKDVLKCDLCGGDPVCVKYCPERPENSLPHLAYPERSCLEFVERKKAEKIAADEGGPHE